MEPPPSRPFQGIPIAMREDANGHGLVSSSSAMQVDMPEPAASGKGHAPHRGRYKEKFTSMKEKHEKAMRSQEIYQKQLELANAKIKKLAAENELLLDALVTSDKVLLDKYFPEETTGQVVGHPAWFEREREREHIIEGPPPPRPLQPHHSNINHPPHHTHVVHHHHHHSNHQHTHPGPNHHHHNHVHNHNHNHEHRGHVQLPSIHTAVQPPPHIVPSQASPYDEGPRILSEYRSPGMVRIGGPGPGSSQPHSRSASSRRGPSLHHPPGGPGPIDRDREIDRYPERDGRDNMSRIGGEREAPLERQRPPRDGPPEPPILTSTFAEPHPPPMSAMPPPPVVYSQHPHQPIALPPPPPPQHAGYPLPPHYSPGHPLPPPQHQPPFDNSLSQSQEMQMQLSPQLGAPNSPPVTLTPQGNGGSSFGRFHVVQRERRKEDDPPPPPPPPVNPNHTVDLGLNTFIPHGEGGRAGVRGQAGRERSKS